MTSKKRICLSNEYCEPHDEIKFKLVDTTAFTPYRGTAGSAGYDLSLVKDTIFPPSTTISVNYKICLELPSNILAKIETRSSMAKLGLTHLGGCIDSDYRGPIHGIIHNLSTTEVYLKRGTRLGQLILIPVSTPDLICCDLLSETERANCGFGSTGLLHSSIKKEDVEME